MTRAQIIADLLACLRSLGPAQGLAAPPARVRRGIHLAAESNELPSLSLYNERVETADAVQPNRFSLSFRRGLSSDHLAGGNDRIAEPVGAGLPQVSLNLEFPNYTSDTFLCDLGADTRKKMRIAFTGDQIEPGYNHALEMLLPHLVITNAEAAVDKSGKITHPITLDCLGTETERAGMTGVSAPLAINLTNTRSSDPLA